MSHRLAAGDLAGLALVACLLPPVGGVATLAFPLATVGLLAALGSYDPPATAPPAWHLLATVTAISGGLAAATLAAGAAADPHNAIALWACSLGALRARWLAVRPPPRCPPSNI